MGLRLTLLIAVALVASACGADATPTPTPDYVGELLYALDRADTDALLDPTILPASEADGQFDVNEPVLVASVNGEERAYSLVQMGIHEVVNDELGGAAIAVTW